MTLPETDLITVISYAYREGVVICNDFDSEMVLRQLEYLKIKYFNESVSEASGCHVAIAADPSECDKKYEYVISDNIIGEVARFFNHGIAYDTDPTFTYENSLSFNSYDSPFTNSSEIPFLKKTIEGDKLDDINLNIQTQIDNALEIHSLIDEFALMQSYTNRRYKWANGWFEGYDGLALYGMIKKYQPKHIIEIGSGYSTALMLDASEFLNQDIQISSIEPFPNRLNSLLRDGDCIDIHNDYVQNVPLSLFDQLEENDILFIDSSHVIKTGGDIPYEYFRILPRLKSGVLIQIHDMIYPFTYPMRWVKQGRPYNEAYLVRALISGNDRYEIEYFGSMINRCRLVEFDNDKEITYPALKVRGGSLWIKKK